jgi:hypothetical protein
MWRNFSRGELEVIGVCQWLGYFGEFTRDQALGAMANR